MNREEAIKYIRGEAQAACAEFCSAECTCYEDLDVALRALGVSEDELAGKGERNAEGE